MRMHRPHFDVLPKTLLSKSHQKRSIHVSKALLDSAPLDVAAVYAQLTTRATGRRKGEQET